MYIIKELKEQIKMNIIKELKEQIKMNIIKELKEQIYARLYGVKKNKYDYKINIKPKKIKEDIQCANSLWDILPIEIQQYIKEIASVTLIQKIYRKNRAWYFRRLSSIKRLNPNYDGKYFRCGDRVLIIRKDRKLQYGTINSISYRENYYCRAILENGKHLYYYKKDDDKYNKRNIVLMRVINSWKICRCDKLNFGNKCDICIIKDIK